MTDRQPAQPPGNWFDFVADELEERVERGRAKTYRRGIFYIATAVPLVAFVYILLALPASFLSGWGFMLAAGVLHSYFPAIPPFAYLESVVALWAFSALWVRVTAKSEV